MIFEFSCGRELLKSIRTEENNNPQKWVEKVVDELEAFQFGMQHLETANMKLFDVWQMESATQKCKTVRIHVRTSENIGPMSGIKMLRGTSLLLAKILDDSLEIPPLPAN